MNAGNYGYFGGGGYYGGGYYGGYPVLGAAGIHRRSGRTRLRAPAGLSSADRPSLPRSYVVGRPYGWYRPHPGYYRRGWY